MDWASSFNGLFIPARSFSKGSINQESVGRPSFRMTDPPEVVIHVLLGDSSANGNRFIEELRDIRSLFGYRRCFEHACIDYDKLTVVLNCCVARIRHFAFHSAYGGVFLSKGGGSHCLSYERVAEQFTRSISRSELLVLNGCESLKLAGILEGWAKAIVCWPDRLTDAQAREHAKAMYEGLWNGLNLEQALASARGAIDGMEDWEKPVVIGDERWKLECS